MKVDARLHTLSDTLSKTFLHRQETAATEEALDELNWFSMALNSEIYGNWEKHLDYLLVMRKAAPMCSKSHTADFQNKSNLKIVLSYFLRIDLSESSDRQAAAVPF